MLKKSKLTNSYNCKNNNRRAGNKSRREDIQQHIHTMRLDQLMRGSCVFFFSLSTSSGAFQVGDFFRIDADGYILKEDSTTHLNPKASSNVNDTIHVIEHVSRSSSSRFSNVVNTASEAAAANLNSKQSTITLQAQSVQHTSNDANSNLIIPSPTNSMSSATYSLSPSPRSSLMNSPSSSSSSSSSCRVSSLSDLIILNPIGQGASGLVQRVVQKSNPNQYLALKVVPLDLSETKSKQILTELRTLHYAQHPNIVSFYGAFYKERSMSLILEYMDRGSLSDIMKRLKAHRLKQQKKRRQRRLLRATQSNGSNLPSPASATSASAQLPSPNSQILSTPLVSEPIISCVARQLLSGLQYLHEKRRLIHRDIKPSNILLNSEGDVKLADFGVSGELQESSVNENKISFVGTITYMSPERIQGHPHSFDSDLWSLGLTLVEMSLGYFPYAKPSGDDDDELSSEDDADDDADERGRTTSECDLDDDDSKDGPSSTRSRRPISSVHTSLSLDSPSSTNSTASTPSHASTATTTTTTTTSSNGASEFSLVVPSGGAKFSKNDTDLYNATQTHLPSPLVPPLASSPTPKELRRPSSAVGHHLPSHSNTHSPPAHPTSRPNSSADVPVRTEKRTSSAATKSRFGFWDVMQRIVQSPAPLLPNRLSRKTGRPKYSEEFRAFIELCLKKDPKERPTTEHLLRHRFITQHEHVDLKEWMKTIPERANSSETSHVAGGGGGGGTSGKMNTIQPPLALTPNFRSNRSPSHAPFLASPANSHTHSPVNNNNNANNTTTSNSCLPPLPHHRRPHHRHHSITESPLAAVVGAGTGLSIRPSISFGSSALASDDECVIETFPVLTSGTFPNAFESVPIEGFENEMPITNSNDMTMMIQPIGVGVGANSSLESLPAATAASASAINFPSTPLTLMMPTTSPPGSGRLKRKPTSDLQLELDGQTDASIVMTTTTTTTTEFDLRPPPLTTTSSEPLSTRSLQSQSQSQVSSSHSATPPSTHVPGSTILKRQKSCDKSEELGLPLARPSLDTPPSRSDTGVMSDSSSLNVTLHSGRAAEVILPFTPATSEIMKKFSLVKDANTDEKMKEQ